MPMLKARLAEEGVDVSRRRAASEVEDLSNRGEVLIFPAGNRTQYRCAGLEETSFLTVLRFAAECVDPSETGLAGKRGASRETLSISTRAYSRIRGAFYKLARGVDPEAGRSTGKLEAALATLRSRDLFRWAAKQTGPGSPGDWNAAIAYTRSVVGDTDAESIGAVRLALDLAASLGLIYRGPLSTAKLPHILETCQSTLEDWRAATKDNPDTTPADLEALLELCVTCGMRMDGDPSERDWADFIPRAEARLGEADNDSRERGAIRRAYRVLRAAGRISGPDWNGRKLQISNGTCLLPRSALIAIGELYGSDGPQLGVTSALEEVDEPWPGTENLAGLIEGDYGLRGCLLAFTARPIHADALELPDRNVFPREELRPQGRGRSGGWSMATCSKALREILVYAGWLSKEKGVDFSQEGADLRVLLDETRVQEYFRAVVSGRISDLRTLETTVRTLAGIASPYCEALAITQGDIGLADRFQRVSRRLSSRTAVGGKTSFATKIKGSGKDREELRKQALLVEATWTGGSSGAKFAYSQLVKVRDAQIAAIEKAMKNRRLEDLVADLREGKAITSLRLACQIRDALLWADQVQVPLRARTIQRMEVGERKHEFDQNGQISLVFGDFGWRNMKGKRRFKPNYATGYPVALYQAYVAAGGARDRLVQELGRNQDRFYLMVPRDRDHPLAGTYRDRAAVNRALRRGLLRALHHDGQVLGGLGEEVSVACTTHAFRHAFGTAMVALGQVLMASEYLHHRNVQLVLDVYSAVTEASMDPGIVLASLSGGGGAPTAAPIPVRIGKPNGQGPGVLHRHGPSLSADGAQVCHAPAAGVGAGERGVLSDDTKGGPSGG